MLSTLALAFGAPAAALLLTRSRTVRRAAADIRGIALQTVVIIVVMLVIAGGVAAVLTSRGGEAISQLEGQGITGANIDTAVKCTTAGGTSVDKTDHTKTNKEDGCLFTVTNPTPLGCSVYKSHDGAGGTAVGVGTANAGCLVIVA